MDQNYQEEEKQKKLLLLREVLKELPPFLGEFFRGIGQTTSVRTRLAYGYDLKLFFHYLTENHKAFQGISLKDITVSHLDNVKAEDIEMFLEYLSYYTKSDKSHPNTKQEYTNDEKGKARKLAAIRSMYKFFYKKGKITANPAAIVDTPKIHQKTIVRLDPNEVATLLDEVESGENLTKRQKAFHEKTKIRDLAIVTLLVGTGIRVSECVGIDIEDIDFDNNGVKVTRKGGNQAVIYFGEEVREALLDCIEDRKNYTKDEDVHALFLSNRGTRITVRQVQNLVKKYSKQAIHLKNISPHKLRSTYGTNLYRETGDIYLVADVLGHADVNTTKKHYAEIEDDRRRTAAKYIKLRRD